MKNLHSLPHHGPHLVCTAAEAERIAELLLGDPGAIGDGVLYAKCRAVLDADPRWKQPLK